jgi:hypothetical protein
MESLFPKAFTPRFPDESTPRTYPFSFDKPSSNFFWRLHHLPNPRFHYLHFPCSPLSSFDNHFSPMETLLRCFSSQWAMEIWNQIIPHHLSWKEIFQMERGKVANEATKEMMNQVKEILEEYSYEEIFQEYPDEACHIEYYEEEFNEDEVLSLNDPDEDIQVVIPPTHQEENIMSYDPFENLDDNLFHDTGSEGSLKDPSDTVDQHIDTFIQIGKRGWDMSLFTFDEDPTYDVDGKPQTKDWYPCIYDSYVWDGNGDMITYFLDPF